MFGSSARYLPHRSLAFAVPSPKFDIKKFCNSLVIALTNLRSIKDGTLSITLCVRNWSQADVYFWRACSYLVRYLEVTSHFSHDVQLCLVFIWRVQLAEILRVQAGIPSLCQEGKDGIDFLQITRNRGYDGCRGGLGWCRRSARRLNGRWCCVIG
jgi:hypothetical protein